MPISPAHLMCLAATPALPTAAVAVLAEHPDPLCRRLIARRRDLPDTQRHVLTRDPDLLTRRYAVEGVTDPGQIAELLTSPLAVVQSGLAANPHTPTEHLDRFASGPLVAQKGERTASASTRPTRAALANPSTSSDLVLDRVSTTPVRDVVLSGPDQHRAFRAAAILAAHPQVQPVWATHADATVVRAVAQRPDLSADAAERIAHRGGTGGHLTLGRNPFVPSELLPRRAWKSRAELEVALAGRDPRLLCADPDHQLEMVLAGSATLDLLLADAALTAPAAQALIRRQRPSVEASALTRMLTTAPLALVVEAGSRLSQTRLTAGADLLPLLDPAGHGALVGQGLPGAVDDAVAALQDSNPATWRVFSRLVVESNASPDDLATVALGTCA